MLNDMAVSSPSNNGQGEAVNPILAHPGLRALLQQQIAIRDGVAPAGTPVPAIMPSSSAADATAPPITPSLPDTPLSQETFQSFIAHLKFFVFLLFTL